MYAKFRITATLLKGFLDAKYQGRYIPTLSFQNKSNDFYSELLTYATGEDGYIDGSMLNDYVFPVDEEYNVFISYSHNDRKIARRLAYYLVNECKLKVFLDEFVWGSADDLLHAIDDEYCMNDEETEYIYSRRNLSTSYIHSLLSMSIMDVISKAECCIFIDSDHSICLDELKGSDAMTLSPWLYEEIFIMNHLPQQPLKRYRFFCDSSLESLNESLNIRLSVDMHGFHNLSYDDLRLLGQYPGTRGLDALYISHKVK